MVTRAEGWGERIVRESEISMNILLYLKWLSRTSLVVLWLGMLLLMQGTWVPSLIQEDSTCLRATKPIHHNYHDTCLEPVLGSKRSHRKEKPAHRDTTRESPPYGNEDPAQPRTDKNHTGL